jgi:hypothetical protein
LSVYPRNVRAEVFPLYVGGISQNDRIFAYFYRMIEFVAPRGAPLFGRYVVVIAPCYVIRQAKAVKNTFYIGQECHVIMKQISVETGGKYFRATDNNSLSKVYKEIDRLEKTKIEINSFKRYAELFLPYAMLGLLFLFLEVVLRNTVFKSLT